MQFVDSVHNIEESTENNNLLRQTIKSALDYLETCLRFDFDKPVSCFAVKDKGSVNILRDISILAGKDDFNNLSLRTNILYHFSIHIFNNTSIFLGINITENISANIKLSDLGVDLEKSQEISNYFEETLNIYMNREKISELSVAE